MYYKDLSKYEYLENRNEIENILNVGWLDLVHPFPKGRELSKNFLSNLLSECIYNPVNLTRGFHQCQFCQCKQLGIPVSLGFKKFRLGSAEIRVKGEDGIIYAAPNLIYHYVKDHHYLPPREFIDAVDNLHWK
jgi:hypothetical protein